jgi:single-stranded-DNA-specific exonuclease
MSKRRWIIKEQQPECATAMGRELGISPLVAQLLINRGITTAEEGREFLARDLSSLHDPFLMLGMAEAVERVRKALAERERIVIYGDYDADGQTATALLVRGLGLLTAEPGLVGYYLPDRLEEGYGLHKEALTKLAERADLIITVDCGISALAEVAHARELGLDIIVTDHHEPGGELPPATAILNPKQPDCSYPFHGLAGVGVAFKLIQALGLPQDKWERLLDLVALGTVADLVPLRDENRVLVFHGLKRLAQTENIGLQALLEVSDVQEPNAGDLGFRLGPRLNAAGRLGDPTRGVRLLITEDQSEAQALALELHRENAVRQDMEEKVVEAAVEIVEKYELHKRSALVVWGKDWHQGVIGIAASRLVERYYLPTIVLTVQDDVATGSARSIEGLDLYDTLCSCSHLFVRFGGHTMAAGLTLDAANLLEFQRCFEEQCAARLEPEDYLPKLYMDGTAPLADIDFSLIEQLEKLEPHGIGNPGPSFQADIAITRLRAVGRDNRHLQLTVQDKTGELPAIAFDAQADEELLERYGESVRIAFVPSINEWAGKKTVQLRVKAWEPNTEGGDYVYRWVVERFPWNFPPHYLLSSALIKEEWPTEVTAHAQIDLRGTWDKSGKLLELRSSSDRTLILVNTPDAALELCRTLRREVPGGKEFIGFDHEFLSEEERTGRQDYSWLVSTGYALQTGQWPSVWLWEPPLNEANFRVWSGLVEPGGELVAVFGPKDLRRRQSYLSAACPDRDTLARIYALLREKWARVDLAWAYKQLEVLGLLAAFPAAAGIFSELGLWEVAENAIIYNPPPAQKLDLNDTVLYNKVTITRKQSTQYLQRCLERGFFQNGLKREN